MNSKIFLIFIQKFLSFGVLFGLILRFEHITKQALMLRLYPFYFIFYPTQHRNRIVLYIKFLSIIFFIMKQLSGSDLNSPNESPQLELQTQHSFLFIACGFFAFIFLMLTLPFYSSLLNQETNTSPIPIQIEQQWHKQNIYAGQVQYPRIPLQYWQHRIKMIKSMGLNALSIYIFWNFHQIERGVFDFETGNKNLTKFLELAEKHGMKVLIRPGPYVCAQWDLGGFPARLLSIQGIELRSVNQIYLQQVKIYFSAVAPILKPFLQNKAQQGPTIILFQIQNQYGFIGTNKKYMNVLREMWNDLGILAQFYYVDWINNIQKSYWQGASIGINDGYSPRSYELVRGFNKNGRLFGGQIYSGWFSLWGSRLNGKRIEQFLDEYRQILTNNHSFAMYMVHGGTSFGLSSGANQVRSFDSLKEYVPLATTYDYDAPINEQGSPTLKFFEFKKLLSYFIDYQVPESPQNIKLMNISSFIPLFIGSIFDSEQLIMASVNSSQKIFLFQSQELKMFHQGIVSYSTNLQGPKQYIFELSVSDLAIVYLDGSVLKVLNRTELARHSIFAACLTINCKMTILVQAMGHINFGPNIQKDKKGLTFFRQIRQKKLPPKIQQNDLILEKSLKMKNQITTKFLWDMHKVGVEDQPQWKNVGKCQNYPCLFKAQIQLEQASDTYLNLSKYQKGYVWVNGHNLGRFWNIGPTFNLFCPGAWLKIGSNTITILDMLGRTAQPIQGTTKSELIYAY